MRTAFVSLFLLCVLPSMKTLQPNYLRLQIRGTELQSISMKRMQRFRDPKFLILRCSSQCGHSNDQPENCVVRAFEDELDMRSSYLNERFLSELRSWMKADFELLDLDEKIGYHMLDKASMDRRFSDEQNSMWGQRRQKAHECRQLRGKVYEVLNEQCECSEKRKALKGCYQALPQESGIEPRFVSLKTALKIVDLEMRLLRGVRLSIDRIGWMDVLRWMKVKSGLVEDKSNYFSYPESLREDLKAEKKVVNTLMVRLDWIKWLIVRDIVMLVFKAATRYIRTILVGKQRSGSPLLEFSPSPRAILKPATGTGFSSSSSPFSQANILQ